MYIFIFIPIIIIGVIVVTMLISTYPNNYYYLTKLLYEELLNTKRLCERSCTPASYKFFYEQKKKAFNVASKYYMDSDISDFDSIRIGWVIKKITKMHLAIPQVKNDNVEYITYVDDNKE